MVEKINCGNFSKFSPFREGIGLHLNKMESSTPGCSAFTMGSLCHILQNNYKVQSRFHNVDDIVTTLGFLQIKLILRRYGLKHVSINYSLCEKLIEKWSVVLEKIL